MPEDIIVRIVMSALAGTPFILPAMCYFNLHSIFQGMFSDVNHLP